MKKPGAPKIQNIAWREGRPRFVPGAPIRRLGFKGEDLKHPDGRWFTAGEALDWATVRAAEIAEKRAGLLRKANAKRPKGAKPLRHRRSFTRSRNSSMIGRSPPPGSAARRLESARSSNWRRTRATTIARR